ncbi:MAG: hypothetical protein V4529_17315 [Gemmatimonadota bacterium]
MSDEFVIGPDEVCRVGGGRGCPEPAVVVFVVGGDSVAFDPLETLFFPGQRLLFCMKHAVEFRRAIEEKAYFAELDL